MTAATADVLVEIGPAGLLDAAVVIVASAPDRSDATYLEPLSGTVGDDLARHLLPLAGLSMASIRRDVAWPLWPGPGREASSEPREALEKAALALRARLAALPNLRLVIALGDEALRAVTDVVPLHAGTGVITKWRGSLLEASFAPLPVYATLNPKVSYAMPGERKKIVSDWTRIGLVLAEIAAGRNPLDLRPRPRILSEPRLSDIEQFRDEVAACAPSEILAFDIETSGGRGESPPRPHILCCGLALSALDSVVIPLTYHYWRSKRALNTAIGLLAEILSGPLRKVGHLALYDTYWLQRVLGISVRNWCLDTAALSHCLDPCQREDLGARTRERRRGLEVLASLHTWRPYWKDIGKRAMAPSAPGSPEATRNFSSLLHYCGLDATATRELASTLLASLGEPSCA